MKKEYDFRTAERGKFHRPNARLIPPVHLESEVLAALTARAQAEGTSLNHLVNKLLKNEIEPIKGRATARQRT